MSKRKTVLLTKAAPNKRLKELGYTPKRVEGAFDLEGAGATLGHGNPSEESLTHSLANSPDGYLP